MTTGEKHLLKHLPMLPIILAHRLSRLVARNGKGGIQDVAERLKKQEMVSSACHCVPHLALTLSPDPEGHKVWPVLSSGCQQGSVVSQKGSAKAPQAVLCKPRGLKHISE